MILKFYIWLSIVTKILLNQLFFFHVEPVGSIY